jgi:hippurate hydrolase
VDAAVARVVEGIAATFGLRSELSLLQGLHATVNHRPEAELAAEAVAGAGLALRRDLPPAMTSEDFSWFLLNRPGAFLWIGNGDGADLHNAGYDFNDAILPAAATALASVARRALREGI